MGWYYGTFSCGHKGRAKISKLVKNEKRKVEKVFTEECPECMIKHTLPLIDEEFEYENYKLEIELPQLKGSEEERKLAISIRQNFINEVDEYLLHCDLKEYRYISCSFGYVLRNKIYANWYIKNKNKHFKDIANQNYDKFSEDLTLSALTKIEVIHK